MPSQEVRATAAGTLEVLSTSAITPLNGEQGTYIYLQQDLVDRQIIDIQGDGLRDQQVTGVFQANDAGSFLEFLARIPGVSVMSSPDRSRYVVTQRAERTSEK